MAENNPGKPEGEEPSEKGYLLKTIYAATLVFLPFIVVLISLSFMRFQRTRDAYRDLADIADQARDMVEKNQKQARETGETIETLLTPKDIVEQIIQTNPNRDSENEDEFYASLVKIVVERKEDFSVPMTLTRTALLSLNDDEESHRSVRAFIDNFWVDMGLQALLLMMIPGLFAARFFQARRRILSTEERRSIVQEMDFRRQKHFLKMEGKTFFWRRLGLAFIAGLATMYMTAPSGLKSSALHEYQLHFASPGQSSLPYWFIATAEAPPIVLGLAGYYIYILTTVLARYQSKDLDNNVVISLFNRGLVVLILGLSLSSLELEGNLAKGIAFIAGVFPKVGIRYLAKLTQMSTQKLESEPGSEFGSIPELGIFRQSTLAEHGILNLHELAVSNLRDLLISTGINPVLLFRSTDRALLIHSFGASMVEKLEQKMNLRTASDIISYVLGASSYESRWKKAAEHKWLGEKARWQAQKKKKEKEKEESFVSLEDYTEKYLATVGFPFENLDEEERKQRITEIETVVESKGIEAKVLRLNHDHNVRYIIDNRIMWGMD